MTSHSAIQGLTVSSLAEAAALTPVNGSLCPLMRAEKCPIREIPCPIREIPYSAIHGWKGALFFWHLARGAGALKA
jgi:hypothetical protein